MIKGSQGIQQLVLTQGVMMTALHGSKCGCELLADKFIVVNALQIRCELLADKFKKELSMP